MPCIHYFLVTLTMQTTHVKSEHDADHHIGNPKDESALIIGNPKDAQQMTKMTARVTDAHSRV